MATRLTKLANNPSTNETSALSAASTLRTSAYNTLWCLGGCAIGDFGTILYFQTQSPHSDLFLVMSLAIGTWLYDASSDYSKDSKAINEAMLNAFKIEKNEYQSEYSNNLSPITLKFILYF